MSDALDSPLVPPALRDALRLSPQNAPLLLHAAETVLRSGGFNEAEALFKRALALEPASTPAKLGLAAAFFQQGKHGAAHVIVEDLVKGPSPAPRSLLLHARLALHAGEPRLAAQQYLRARDADAALTDSTLEAELASHLPKRPALQLPKNPISSASAAADDMPSFLGENADESADEDRDVNEPQALPAGDLPADTSADEPERPTTTFADVGGMDQVKEEVRMKIILPLQQPDLFKAYGKKIGGGILMYGPP